MFVLLFIIVNETWLFNNKDGNDDNEVLFKYTVESYILKNIT